MGNPNMSLLDVEAYSLPSSTFVENDSHCFVVSKDRNTCWRNKGRGWNDGGNRTKVAEGRVYKEWLMEFMPPGDIDRGGLNFSVNGVCHTYANRELLLCENAADAHKAAKDYVCVWMFGKYGMGLNQLKDLLRSSYARVTTKYNDPYGALDKILARVDDYLDDELLAWRQVAIDDVHIPVERILDKNRSGGIATARQRLKNYINDREALYQQYLDRKITDTEVFQKSVLALIMRHADDYLSMLARIRYISESEKTTYVNNIQTFFKKLQKTANLQLVALQTNGALIEDLVIRMQAEGTL